MAKVRGRDGVVKIGANTVGAVVGFSLEETMEPIDDTELNSVEMTHVSGDTSWSATIECMWDKADTTGQGAMTIGASVALILQPEGDTSGDETRSGTASIVSKASANAKGEMVSQSFSLQGSGALTVGAVA
ncbi:hypothetical protein [uncultured Paraglaciecola sp.]|uniref:hypothetical protein n=1 Tax=uncultured Paraglaciecola sp. TaxID=1765024 RepID=UPI00261A947A|nr:hypothetical protein [uncultured Paraglaciecola sp.]